MVRIVVMVMAIVVKKGLMVSRLLMLHARETDPLHTGGSASAAVTCVDSSVVLLLSVLLTFTSVVSPRILAVAHKAQRQRQLLSPHR